MTVWIRLNPESQKQSPELSGELLLLEAQSEVLLLQGGHQGRRFVQTGVHALAERLQVVVDLPDGPVQGQLQSGHALVRNRDRREVSVHDIQSGLGPVRGGRVVLRVLNGGHDDGYGRTRSWFNKPTAESLYCPPRTHSHTHSRALCCVLSSWLQHEP